MSLRLNLANDLKTRTGAPNKDARLTNCYIEQRPNGEAAVRKRPSARGGVPVGTGKAQGGIGLVLNGVPTFIGFWGDTLRTFSAWSSLINYNIGDAVYYPDTSDPFANPATLYYAMIANSNINPTTPYVWSTTPPTATRYIGNFLTVDGPIAGSIDSAGWAAWNANMPYKTCATKAPATQLWETYDHTDNSTLKIYIHEWTDTPPYTCSTAPLDFGVLQASPTDIVRIV